MQQIPICNIDGVRNHHVKQLAAHYKAAGLTTEQVADALFVTEGFVRYYDKKACDPSFHSGRHGGARNFRFDSVTQLVVENLVLSILRDQPGLTIKQVSAKFEELTGDSLSPMWISRMYKRLNMTVKKIGYRVAQKYSKQNLRFYVQFVQGLRELPPEADRHLKYLDESHFENWDLRRERGVGPRGQRLFVTQQSEQRKQSYSVTLLTTPYRDEAPLWLSDPRLNSNTAVDFFKSLLEMVEEKAIVEGDYVILDNGPTHVSEETSEKVKELTNLAKFRLIFLPAYSPELNPCENIFSHVKREMRKSQGSGLFQADIINAFANVTQDIVLTAYDDCNRIR